jgi:hypothetical protein
VACRCGMMTAVSSRGLGRGPLKAQTRVRIPLPLLLDFVAKNLGPVRLSVRTAPFHGAERGSIPLRAIVKRREGVTGGQGQAFCERGLEFGFVVQVLGA